MTEIKKFSFEYLENDSQIQIPDDINIITVNNCPSAIAASKLISELLSKDKVKNLKHFKGLILKIISKFEIDSVEIPKISDCNKNYFLISLEPKNITNDYQSIIFWKIKERINFLQFKNNKEYSSDVFTLVREFLIKSNIAEYVALDRCSSSKDVIVELTSLIDENNCNILMLAVDTVTNSKLIQELLKFPFDINQELKESSYTAADIAWNKKKFEILLLLLNANSTFPKDYDEDNASAEIRNFASTCREMHDAARESDIIKAKSSIEKIVKKFPNLRYFYNTKNKSAAAVALKMQNVEVYKLLVDKSVHVGPQEDTEGIRNKFTIEIQRALRAVHLQCSKDLPGRHIMTFMSNSFIGHDDLHSIQRYKLVKNAYNILDSIEICSVLLKIVAAKKIFKIIYDFNRPSVEFLDPTKDKTILGNFYLYGGKIYIGAKEMLKRKFEVTGTIIHEVCHYTMLLVFQNDCKPYAEDDAETKKEFEKIVEECRATESEENLINWVFGYSEDLFEAELIVRVVHLTVHYHKNQEKLKALKKTFSSLFEFYEQKVVPQVELATPIIAKLADQKDKLELTFEDLTKPLRDKIFNLVITFQGFDIELYEIINCGPNSAIYSEKIFDFFSLEEDDIFEADIKIGEKLETTEKFYIERKFLKPNLAEKNKWDVKSCEEIAKEVRDEKIFLLSDHAGAGKTTTFKNLAVELRNNFPNFWISFVDLKAHLKIYERYENLDEKEWTKDKILEFLKEILNLNVEKEKEHQRNLNLFVFCELFEKDKIILLFDGVDEISPNFKELIKILIKKIRELTKIQLWIATRPQYTEELEEYLAINARRLKPSDDKENENFIKEILKSLNVIDDEKQKIAIEKVKEFISKLKNGNEDHAIKNPLMLEIITTICADSDTAEANFYSIYHDMLRKKFEDVHKSRGDIVSKDAINCQWMDKNNFSIWQVFQVYSLQLIFGNSFKDVMSDFVEDVQLSKLSIFKKWSIAKKNWEPEQISRYGVLIVDNFNENNEKVDFIHRTFAEFFVAQYLIDNIYKEMDNSVNDDEKLLRLKLLISIGATKSTELSRLDVIRRFLICYPTSRRQKGDTSGPQFNDKIRNFLINNYRTSYLFYSKEVANYDAVTATLFLSNFFVKDKKVIEALWLGSDNRSFFGKIFSSTQNNLHDLMEYVETVERIFGPAWPELTKFIPKKGKKNFFEGREVKYTKDALLERFFGLLDLVQNRLLKKQCEEFFRKYFYDMVESFYVNNEAISDVMSRTKLVFGGKKQLANLTQDYIEKSHPKSSIFNENFAQDFWNYFKDFVKSDEKFIKSVLKFEYVPTNQLLLNAFSSNNQKIVEFYENLFIEHLKNEEILKIFVISKGFYVNNLFWRILHMENESCEKFLEFLSSLKSEKDENFKKFFTQRDDKSLTIFDYLRAQCESSKFPAEKRVFEEKFEIFKTSAKEVFTKDELNELCKGLKDEKSFFNYFWTKIVNRRE